MHRERLYYDLCNDSDDVTEGDDTVDGMSWGGTSG